MENCNSYLRNYIAVFTVVVTIVLAMLGWILYSQHQSYQASTSKLAQRVDYLDRKESKLEVSMAEINTSLNYINKNLEEIKQELKIAEKKR